MNQLQVLGGGIPTIEQDTFCLDSLGIHSIDDHFREVLVLGLAILVRRINTIIYRVEILLLASAMYQIDNANAAYQTVFCTTILEFHQFDEL